MITVKVFAQFREQLGIESLELDDSRIDAVSILIHYLVESNAEWQSVLRPGSFLCAVNHTLVSPNVSLKDGDEVAFFPPVTGG